MAPTIVLVPGLWEGPTVFDNISNQLQAAGFETSTAALASTGTKSPGNPSTSDDVAAIRKHIAAHVEQGKEVLLVLHSAGGFLGSAAIEDLEAKKRFAAGKNGGVSKIDGIMSCQRPEELLFHDVPDTDKWMKAMGTQPAEGWNEVISYTGWEHVPCVYVVSKNDKIIPVELQQRLAGLAKADTKVLDSGHMLPLSKPDEVAAIIKEAAAASA